MWTLRKRRAASQRAWKARKASSKATEKAKGERLMDRYGGEAMQTLTDRQSTPWAEATPYQKQLAAEHRARMARWNPAPKPPPKPPPWTCQRCGQLNAHWAKECGRCEKLSREDPPPPLPRPDPLWLPPAPPSRWLAIELLVAKELNIPRAALVSDRRLAALVDARRLCSWLMKELVVGISISAIGRHLHRDHTTIMHHLRIKDDLLARNHALRQRYLALRDKARGIIEGIEPCE